MSLVSSANTAKYTCKLCGYQTSWKSKVTLHEAIHEGKKSQCPECDYQATRKDHLVTHHKSVHMGQHFQCPHCDVWFSLKGSLDTQKEICTYWQKVPMYRM